MKITVVGAGAVGASCAEYIAIKNFASEVVILDIKEGFAEGKAMDLMQTASLNNFDTKIVGTTNDYSKTADSDICVITSGIPRKPGMTREELIGINAGIVKEVSSNLIKSSPETIIIVVSNPMDTMTYLVLNSTGLPIPYRHETDATTITSLLPESNVEVVLSLNFSISSFMDKSFSM